jgi:cyclic pyranopterin monophosphate synthase
MVDVGAKPETLREAVASAAVRMSAATLALVRRGTGARGKGDVIGAARLAGLMALKRVAEWIPLCHPVRVVGSAVEVAPDPSLPGLRIVCIVRAFDRTGVEMEAMVGRVRHGQGGGARRRDPGAAARGEERGSERNLEAW